MWLNNSTPHWHKHGNPKTRQPEIPLILENWSLTHWSESFAGTWVHTKFFIKILYFNFWFRKLVNNVGIRGWGPRGTRAVAFETIQQFRSKRRLLILVPRIWILSICLWNEESPFGSSYIYGRVLYVEW